MFIYIGQEMLGVLESNNEENSLKVEKMSVMLGVKGETPRGTPAGELCRNTMKH